MPRTYKRSKFERRHYEAIAEVLRGVRADISDNMSPALVLGKVEAELVRTFSRDNGSFQPERFRKAASWQS